MEKPILKDPEVFPDNNVLKNVLKDSYPAFEELNKKLQETGITLEWNYYKDGNAWLCKVPFKKKNLAWLAPYNGYFRTTIYFMERHMEKVAALDIAEQIKDDFAQSKPTGKLIPLPFLITNPEQVKDVLTALELKKVSK